MNQDSMPKHVAIIMDGNGRWAERRGHSRVYGHIRGAKRVNNIVRCASDLGIQVITFFAFSTENWKRPQSELTVLWKILEKFIDKEIDELDRKNVRFRAIGELEKLQPHLRKKVLDAETRLSQNTGIQLNFALSYGGRAELIRATRLFAEDCLAGKASPQDLEKGDAKSEALLERYLWTGFLKEHSNVDLLIRTSGEKRISNFLLWQSAYSELIFTDVLWPDFLPAHLSQALQEYAERERRFGSVEVAPISSTPRMRMVESNQ